MLLAAGALSRNAERIPGDKKIDLRPTFYLSTDTVSFLQTSVPMPSFTPGTYADYHCPGDSEDKWSHGKLGSDGTLGYLAVAARACKSTFTLTSARAEPRRAANHARANSAGRVGPVVRWARDGGDVVTRSRPYVGSRSSSRRWGQHVYSSEDRHHCYRDSSTLKNLIDIRDAAAWPKPRVTSLASAWPRWLVHHRAFVFGSEFLKELRRRLFQEAYEWPGATVRIDLSKGQTRSAVWEQVEPEAENLFGSTAKTPAPLSGTQRQWLIDTAAPFLAELNVIYPFRDGNGWTMQLFVEMWANSKGLPLDWGQVQREKIVEPMIQGVALDDNPLGTVLDA